MESTSPAPVESPELLSSVPFFGGDKEVRRYRYKNGLTLLFLEDHSAPIFSFQSWYKVGSSWEEKGKTGLAHFFEHLMFKATEKRPEGEFDRIMEKHGAQTNAGTWLDWTYYYESLPSGTAVDAEGNEIRRGAKNLELVAELEADRMTSLSLEEESCLAELEVVKNERRLRVDNDPEGQMDEKLWSMAFDRHPYGWPTIGWMEDLETMNLEDARDFYRRFYAPNQLVVVISGDLMEEDVLSSIGRHFAPIPAQEVERPEFSVELPLDGERRETMELPLSAERALLGYRVPAIDHKDRAALEILSGILFNSDSARAELALIHEEELALEVGAWLGSFKDPSLWQVTLVCQRGKKIDEALTSLERVFQRVCEGGVDPQEVTKARNKLRVGILRGMLSAHNRGYQLGFYEVTAGDHRALFDYLEKIDAVTPEDVRRVAKAYLRTENRCAVLGMPAKSGAPEASESQPGPLHRCPPMERSPGDVNTDFSSDMELLGAESFELGPLKGVVIHDPDLPYVSFMLDFHRGSLHEPEDKQGVARLVGGMMMRGTKKRSRREIAEALDRIGSALDIRVRRNTTTLVGDASREHLSDFLDLLVEILWSPSFNEDELSRLRRQTLSELESIREDDGALARIAFSRTLYKGHPLERSLLGTEESLARVTVKDLEEYHAQTYLADRMLFGVSGAVSKDEIVALLEARLGGGAPVGGAEVPEIAELPAVQGRVLVLVDKPERSQTQIAMGHPGLVAAHPDAVPLSLGNTAMGGTFTSRMMQEVRVKRGWSYGAYSRFNFGRDWGSFSASLYPKTEDTVPAIRLVLELFEQIRDGGLTEEEIGFAREYSTQVFPFALETHPKRLQLLMGTLYLKRPADWILNHTKRLYDASYERVSESLSAHLDPDNMVVAVTCTAADILDEVREIPGLSELWIQAYDQPWNPRRVGLSSGDDSEGTA